MIFIFFNGLVLYCLILSELFGFYRLGNFGIHEFVMLAIAFFIGIVIFTVLIYDLIVRLNEKA